MNSIKLVVEIDGVDTVTHYCLHEFIDKHGWVLLHASVLVALEKTRSDLGKLRGEEITIHIQRPSSRTQAHNEALALQLGWTDEGGKVSRNSRHLEKFGGIAVDFIARLKRTGEPIQASIVGMVSRRYFDYVKDNYGLDDPHVHGDMRYHADAED